MTIKILKEDIFRGTEDVIVHGCNCFHTMNSGIASLVRKYYPLAYDTDCFTKKSDKMKIGSYSYCITKHVFYEQKTIMIVNAYTQYGYGNYHLPDNGVQFDYDAFLDVLDELNLKINEEKSFAFPKIGCGLAGGDWEKVLELFSDYFDIENGKYPDRKVVLYDWD